METFLFLFEMLGTIASNVCPFSQIKLKTFNPIFIWKSE